MGKPTLSAQDTVWTAREKGQNPYFVYSPVAPQCTIETPSMHNRWGFYINFVYAISDWFGAFSHERRDSGPSTIHAIRLNGLFIQVNRNIIPEIIN
jgi:hypothetical protein